MHQLYGSWHVWVEARHASNGFHDNRVVDGFIGYRDAELKDFKVHLSCLSNITIHINLVVELLVHLNDIGLIRCFLVHLQGIEEILHCGRHIVLIKECKLL